MSYWKDPFRSESPASIAVWCTNGLYIHLGSAEQLEMLLTAVIEGPEAVDKSAPISASVDLRDF